MTPKQEAALRQAVDAWFRPGGINYVDFKPYMDALREALAEQQSGIKQVIDLYDSPEQSAQQQEPVGLRRGNILRCIETDELCTVWSTSTTGKTLVKWNANEFGAYTAEQIGELFWLEPEPDDLELAAEKSDNYAAFHAGYRFAVAHSSAEQPAQQQEPVAIADGTFNHNCPIGTPLYTSPPASKPEDK